MKAIDDVRPGVAVVILDEKKRVLLQKRADVGLWGLPSGHVEKGETVAEAAIREMKEEANLEIRIVKLIGVYSEPESQVFAYPNGKVVHFITICFLAEVVGESFVVILMNHWISLILNKETYQRTCLRCTLGG